MKKALFGLLISVMSFVGLSNASAKVLTLNEVATKYNELNVNITSDQCTGKVTAVVDGTILSMRCNGEEIFIFVADSGTVTYTNPDTPGSIHKNDAAVFTLVDNLLEAILLQSGYEKMSLPTEVDHDALYLVTDNYVYLPENMPADYRYGKALGSHVIIKRMDVSLDTTKIGKLVQDEGDPYIRKILEAKPTLDAKNIKSTSLELYPTVANTPSDKNYTARCVLYRSLEEDSDYTAVATPDNCLTGVKLSETGLDADTTYFYKIRMVGSTIESDPIAITTEARAVTPGLEEPGPSEPDPTEPDPEVKPNPGTDPDKPNPDTGDFVPAVVLGLFTIGSIGTIIYTGKRNKFKNLDI